jgi:hypothetical protein
MFVSGDPARNAPTWGSSGMPNCVAVGMMMFELVLLGAGDAYELIGDHEGEPSA